MNYYERHIGDYLKDTSHLSLLEHGVYARLLDVYYTRESALPDAQIARLVGARSKDEVAALRAVLAEYFVQEDSGDWVQMRCEREIERYQKKAAHNREVGKLGGRPKKSETQTKPTGLSPGSETGTQGEPKPNPPSNQTPVTSNQEEADASSARAGTAAGRLCRTLRAAGISTVNPSSPRLLSLLEAGATEGEFTALAAKALSVAGDPFAYLLGAVEGERKRAAATAAQLHRGELPAAETAYQRSMRERMEEASPSIAAKRPGVELAPNPMDIIDGYARITG